MELSCIIVNYRGLMAGGGRLGLVGALIADILNVQFCLYLLSLFDVFASAP